MVEILSGIVAFVIYFLPSIIAKHHRQRDSIVLLNLFLGWTFIGWVVALVWASKKPEIAAETVAPSVPKKPATTSQSVAAEINRLQALYDTGQISGEELIRRKTKVFSQPIRE